MIVDVVVADKRVALLAVDVAGVAALGMDALSFLLVGTKMVNGSVVYG